MEDVDHIDAYFDGEISPEEASRFERRIEEDPVFAEEVAGYLGALAALRETNAEERKKRFQELYRQGVFGDGAAMWRVNSRRWLTVSAAAVFFGMLALAWLLFLRPPGPSSLADRYIRQNLAILPAKMGSADGVQMGISLYNSGQFAAALLQFEQVLGADPLNPAAMNYAGIVSLRMGNYDHALDLFTKLEIHTDPHVNPAIFYQALTLMRRDHAGDSDHAKQLLRRIVQEDLNRKGEAQELLSKM